jgi:hypothetical protein
MSKVTLEVVVNKYDSEVFVQALNDAMDRIAAPTI